MSDSLETEIKSLKQDITYIKQFIEEDRKRYVAHVDSAQGFRDRVIILEGRVDGHSTEHVTYRWLFGIIITIGLAMLAAMLRLITK